MSGVADVRVAIYARFSSDRQSDRSIEDQVRLCREKAEREGWKVVDVFPDFALSGATRDRPGLNALLARIGDFDVVLSEALDRISRDQEDVAAIWKRVEFAGSRLVTVSEGAVGELQIGFTGTMSAVFLKNLGDKTRRGQVGRVAAGRIPGGLCYGYEVDVHIDSNGVVDRGRRKIVPEQAEVIRRIYGWRAEGRAVSWIVNILNREAVPGPNGGPWRINTISGSRKRRNGILHNELYAGRIVFNRQRFVRDPVTRKRVSRPNPESEWKTRDVPELAIVDAETWKAVSALESSPERLAGIRQKPAKRLLSGLITCGLCGGSFIVIGMDRWGCSTAKGTMTCANKRSISTGQLEDRVLGALRDRLLSPDLVKEFVAEYQRSAGAAAAKEATRRNRLTRTRAKVTGQIERLTDMMADGIGIYAEMKKRLATALSDRARIDAEIDAGDAIAPVALHPELAEAYRRNVASLTETLNDPSMRDGDARQALRNLVERITAEPKRDGRGLDLIVHGRLAQILHIANNRPDVGPDGCMFNVVAGTGFEPVTFRL